MSVSSDVEQFMASSRPRILTFRPEEVESRTAAVGALVGRWVVA